MTPPRGRLLRIGGAATAIVVAGVLISQSSGGPGAAPPHRALTIAAGSLRLRGVRAGSGRVVVLLHGYGESLMSWRGVFDRLALEHDVLALDLPGFGLSDKPAGGYATDSIAATVVRALEAQRIGRAVIVGHSMGGAVALAVAVRAPERVSALALVDPAVSASAWDLAPPSDSATGTGWMRRALASYEVLRPRFTAPHDPLWLAEEPGALAYSPAGDPAYRVALEAVLREFDFDYLNPARAQRLTLPILLIWGQYDQVIPLGVGQAMARALPTARLAVVPRSLHRPQVERPDQVGALLDEFLRSLAVPRPGGP